MDSHSSVEGVVLTLTLTPTLTLTLTLTPTPTLTLTLPLTVQDLGVPISSASLCREGLVLHLQARMGMAKAMATAMVTGRPREAH